MERQRRQIKAPKRLGEHDQTTKQEKRSKPLREVYRILTKKDVHRDLKDQQVHILWPVDGVWYAADILELRVKDMAASVKYPATNEFEDIDLDELIKEKCIAVVELRNPNAKLRTNEVPVHAEDGGNMEYADDVQDSDYHSEEGSDEILPDDNQLDSDADVSDDDVDVGTRSRRAKQTTAKKTSKKQGSSNAAAAAADPGISEQQQEPSVISPQGAGIMPPTSAAVSPSAPGQPPLGMLFIPTAALGTPASAAGHSSPKQPAVAEGDTAAPKRRLSGSTAELPIKRRHSETSSSGQLPAIGSVAGVEGDTDSKAEASKRAMLERLLAKKGITPAPPTPTGKGISKQGSGRLQRTSSSSGGGQQGLADRDIRQRAAEQLAVGLSKAVQEAAAKADHGGGSDMPDAQELGVAVEEALYDLHGAVDTEYKSKLRSLMFNLKDPNNPDLRGQVLTGHLTPAALVRMTPAELASRELSQWRRQREQQHEKEIVLDVETAAKVGVLWGAMVASTRDSSTVEEELLWCFQFVWYHFMVNLCFL
eukprot:jgi/Chrzof1/9658/Cz04g11080.t1